jgi:hypothetical protein
VRVSDTVITAIDTGMKARVSSIRDIGMILLRCMNRDGL